MTFSITQKQAPSGTHTAGSDALRAASDMHAPLPVRIDSRQLLGDQREIEIEHEGSLYRLRLTHSGKLILTK